LWRFDARADHLCFEALKVVDRSLRGVNVLDESGVVVLRRGVTDGAMVTLGRVDERLVDAWDWARALSGIFVVVCRCAVLGVQRAFETGGCVTPPPRERQRHWAAGTSRAITGSLTRTRKDERPISAMAALGGF
jgi:hypothetical protein